VSTDQRATRLSLKVDQSYLTNRLVTSEPISATELFVKLYGTKGRDKVSSLRPSLFLAFLASEQ